MRRGVYKGPLVMNWVAISGGMDAPNIYNLANFVRATPDGAVLTVESSMRNVLPVNMMGIAMGLHVRCGIEDNLWNQARTKKASTVEQIEQLVRISREFGRPVATAQQAREISKIGVFYDTVEEIAAGQRLRTQPQRRPPGLPAQGGLSNDRRGAHRPDRSRPARPCGRALADAARGETAALPRGTVPPMGRKDLDCAARVEAIEREAQAIEGPLVLVAHSGGCVMVGALGTADAARPCWARCWPPRPISNAPCPPATRAWTTLQAGGWLPVPRQRLPFASIVAASRNDPLGRIRARRRIGGLLGQPAGRPG